MTDVAAAVRLAWAACFPSSGGAGDLTFAEAGGDSLQAMRFVHDLGLVLGCELPLDVLGMDDTITDVVAAVRRPAPSPAEAATAATPRLALVTGAYGDEPALAGLRRRLVGIDVTTLEPPGVEASDDLLASLERMALDVSARVPREDPIHLAGFSFGGPLALLAALHLARAGRDVASLALLDAPYSRDATWLNLWKGRGTLARAWWALQTLPGRWAPARMAVVRAAPLVLRGRDVSHAVRRRMLDPSRRRALSSWTPSFPPIPTLIVLGDGLGEANAASWREAAPTARHLRVTGGHGDVMRGANLDLVADAMLALVAGQAG